MTRSGQQRARRACLADAASGIYPVASSGVSRVRVVLYGSGLKSLRAYAEARDWSVVGEFTDRFDAPDVALLHRPVWPSVAEVLSGRRAEGLVTDVSMTAADLEHVSRLGAFSARVAPSGLPT